MSDRALNAYYRRQAIMQHGTAEEQRDYQLGVLKTRIEICEREIAWCESLAHQKRDELADLKVEQEKWVSQWTAAMSPSDAPGGDS